VWGKGIAAAAGRIFREPNEFSCPPPQAAGTGFFQEFLIK